MAKGRENSGGRRRAMVALLGLAAVLASFFVLETARSGVEISRLSVGPTPVMNFSHPGAEGPVVVIAHGFAGSSQMMQGYALPLARAGYRVFAFDFLGHGRNGVPMSGDVTSADGTTRLLVDQTGAVIDAVAGDGTVALIGHSMATDILVRVAASRDDIGPLVLLSAFSREITASEPDDMLLVTGAWEPGLDDFALEAARMVGPDATSGETVTADGITRRAVIAPASDHVSILHSRVGRAEAVDWLDRFYGRSSDTATPATGWAIIGLVAGLVVLLRAGALALPREPVVAAADLSRGRLATVLLLPAALAPPLAVWLEPDVIPVLVADYLALHLALYGAVQLALLRLWGVPFGRLAWPGLAFLVLASAVIGLALDRYAANFWPVAERLWIILAIAPGALLFFLADARLSHRASRRRRLAVHGAFLASLGLAVALDFEGLFFLLMIAPVVVLFFAVFGTLGHASSSRSGPLAAGLGLGLVLAWSLGVSFPLFQS